MGIGGGDDALTADAKGRSKRSIALRLIVSITVFAWIASRIDWRAVGAFARNISAGWALAAFAAFLPTLLLNTRRWQLLLHGQNVPLSFRRALELMLVGQFFNAFLIGTTGGDRLRISVNGAAAQKATAKRPASPSSSIVFSARPRSRRSCCSSVRSAFASSLDIAQQKRSSSPRC